MVQQILKISSNIINNELFYFIIKRTIKVRQKCLNYFQSKGFFSLDVLDDFTEMEKYTQLNDQAMLAIKWYSISLLIHIFIFFYCIGYPVHIYIYQQFNVKLLKLFMKMVIYLYV